MEWGREEEEKRNGKVRVRRAHRVGAVCLAIRRDADIMSDAILEAVFQHCHPLLASAPSRGRVSLPQCNPQILPGPKGLLVAVCKHSMATSSMT